MKVFLIIFFYLIISWIAWPFSIYSVVSCVLVKGLSSLINKFLSSSQNADLTNSNLEGAVLEGANLKVRFQIWMGTRYQVQRICTLIPQLIWVPPYIPKNIYMPSLSGLHVWQLQWGEQNPETHKKTNRPTC